MKSPTKFKISNISTDEQKETMMTGQSKILVMLIPLAFVLGLGAGYTVWGMHPGSGPVAPQAAVMTTNQTAQVQVNAPTATATAPKRYDVPVDDDPFLGPSNAPITLIEFSDFECPYCKKWHDEVFSQLLKEYPDQIRFVYRDFPLSNIHGNAAPAAEAADCAWEQTNYWDYYSKLFNGQYGLSQDAYQKYAQEMGLDKVKFNECLTSRRYQDEVQNDFDFAAKLGIRSTPTFFINGLAVVGAQPYEVFKQIIDQELAGEIP